jgi:hypothetical protein
VTAVGPEAEEAYMTIAEMLRAEGRAEGRTEGRTEMLVEQLALRFGPLDEADLRTVQGASVARLRTWSARVLTAETLDQVLADR